jgi:hypothetical protein
VLPDGVHLALAILTFAGALFVQAPPASAHHSFAMFDRDKTQTVTGTVRNYEWTAPHVYIWVNVKNEKGADEVWGVEVGGGPNMLVRAGWTRSLLQQGDKVTLVVHPLRDGRTGGMFMNMTLANGQTYKSSPLQQ